nr:MAG TPA: hypothetical protein [Caudoviricetes sp.]
MISLFIIFNEVGLIIILVSILTSNTFYLVKKLSMVINHAKPIKETCHNYGENS